MFELGAFLPLNARSGRDEACVNICEGSGKGDLNGESVVSVAEKQLVMKLASLAVLMCIIAVVTFKRSLRLMSFFYSCRFLLSTSNFYDGAAKR